MKRLTSGDQRGIERIVERLHVGTPDGQVIQYVRSRIKNFRRLPSATQAAVDRYSLAAHRGNQRLYGHVTSGLLKNVRRRNPDLGGRAQWDAFEKKYRELGREGFRTWLSRRIANSAAEQRRIVDLMAWNDHNSDWFLFRGELRKTGTIQGETITVGDIVNSMLNYMEYSTTNPRGRGRNPLT